MSSRLLRIVVLTRLVVHEPRHKIGRTKMRDRIFIIMITLVSCCFAQSRSQQSATGALGSTMIATNSIPKDYVIGSEDVLAVNIWKEPEISRTVPVRPDGKITLPLIGDVQASGLTPQKLENTLKEGLKAYVANPEVTVIVQEVKSLKFNIVGEINHPGSFALSQPMTVLDAIAVGGGLRDFAKGSKIYVLRGNTRLPFNYKDVIKGKKLTENVALQSGDTVVVP